MLLQLILVLVVLGLVLYLVQILPLEPPFVVIIRVLVILCAIFYVIQLLSPGLIPLRLR